MTKLTARHLVASPFIALVAIVSFGINPIECVHAQVVQLPGISQFSSSGGVIVPDRGSASLGGFTNSANSQVSTGWGPLQARGRSMAAGTADASVSAHIIDLKAMDEAILAARPTSTTLSLKNGKATESASFQSRYLDAQALRNGPQSSSATDTRRWAESNAVGGEPTYVHSSMVEANVRYYLQRGDTASKEGRLYAARVYYRMAIDAMTPELRSKYDVIVARNESAKASVKVDNPKATSTRSF